MPTSISAPKKRYVDAATLLDAIQALQAGIGSGTTTGGTGGTTTIDFQPALSAIAQLSAKIDAIAPFNPQSVLTAIAQLSAKMDTIDQGNDAATQQNALNLETKLMALMEAIEQIQTAFSNFSTQHQQLVSVAENAAAAAATANAAAASLQQANALLAANDQADANTIASLQQDIATKEQSLASAQQQAAQALADKNTLQQQMAEAEAALRAILDGQTPPPAP